jgi:hypothetical protein
LSGVVGEVFLAKEKVEVVLWLTPGCAYGKRKSVNIRDGVVFSVNSGEFLNKKGGM